MKKIIKRGVIIFLCWFFIHSTYISIDGLRNFSGKADIAVVLGNTVFKDGSLSPWLKGRVDKVYELYKNGQVKKIFVSGGGNGTRFPEGDAMRNYLVKKGVDSNDVIADNKGINSYHTAVDFADLNRQNKYSGCVVVTSFYHVSRCKYIIRKLGFKNVSSDHSEYYSLNDSYGLFREFFAFYKYMLVY